MSQRKVIKVRKFHSRRGRVLVKDEQVMLLLSGASQNYVSGFTIIGLPLLILLDGEPEELCFAGERLDVVFKLLLGLEADPPDKDDSVRISRTES